MGRFLIVGGLIGLGMMLFWEGWRLLAWCGFGTRFVVAFRFWVDWWFPGGFSCVGVVCFCVFLVGSIRW